MKTYRPIPGVSHRLRTDDARRHAGRRGTLWLLAVVLVGGGGLACSSWLAREAVCPNPRDVRGCTPAKGLPPSDCTIYEKNKDWLPAAYVYNATCVCKQAPNDKTADCTAAKIQAQTLNLPDSIKQQGRLCNSKGELERDACFEQFLPQILYHIHERAFKECCCPCGPSPYASWKLITVLQATSCPEAGDLFEVFGSCHGTPGKW